jgi:restriction system protein
MFPLLKFIADKQEHSLWQAIDVLANQFNLTQDEQRQLLPSGQQSVFYNRSGWARTYMKQAGLIESTRRGYFRITERGLQVLKENPSKMDSAYLERFPEFLEFKKPAKEKQNTVKETVGQEKTPVETIETAYQNLRNALSSELLDQMKMSPPSLFENIVIDLLVKMGYGGSRKDAGEAVGKTGDGGIDGIIREDRLGLDVIYVQAKRWDQTVIGRPEIQRFAGALQGKHARKGIFISTSTFSKEAYEYASSIESKIILIDGNLLTQSMIEYNVGVTADRVYEIKKLDSDYFIEE